MKPLELTMTAFGPYKDQETIDFTELKDNRLFVIAGNTGAGKTTIFDGISFALYGEASGQDRDRSLMMRSDFADDDVHTSVELRFTINGHIYRILRQLGHIKAGNKSKTGEHYEFFEQLESGKEIPCVDRQMVTEIDQKVEDLIGLTQDQFKQIVMLPQGEFRKLLTSKTENKEDILRRLFKTDTYKQITDQLQVKKDEANELFNRRKQTYDHYIGTIEAVLPKRNESHLFNALSENYMNANHILAGLAEELSFYKGRIDQDEKQYAQAYQTHNEKQAQWHQAKGLNETFAELKEKQDHLESMNNQVSEYEKKEKQLETAERSNRIVPYEKQLQKSRETEQAKQKHMADAEKAHTRSKEKFTQAEIEYQSEEQKHSNREEARRELDKLNGFVPAVEAFRDIEKSLESLHKTKKVKETQFKQLQTEAKTIKDQLTHNKQTYNKLESVPSELSKQTIQLEKMREKARVLGEFLTAQHTVERNKTNLRTKKTTYEQAKKEYDQLESEWLNSHAELLANHLHTGEACPVCGSTAHPRLANTVSTVVSKRDFEVAKQEKEKWERLFHDANTSLKSAESILNTQTNAAKLHTENIRDARSDYDDLVPAGQELKAHIKTLEKQNKQRDHLKNEIETTEVRYDKLEEQVKDADNALQQAIANMDKKKTIYEERKQSVPENYRDLNVLKQAIETAEKHKQQMETTWDQAKTNLQQASQDSIQTETSLNLLKKQVQEAATNRHTAEMYFREQLKQAGFTDEQFYQSSKMDDNAINELKASINTFKQQRLLLMEQTTDLSKKLEGQTKQDITSLEKEKESLKSAYETAFKTWKQSQDYYKQAEKLYINIGQSHQQVEEAEERLAQLAHLYNVLRGQNNQKISFERYLQIEYLEQIIAAANERLRNLSNGQFYLMRSGRQEAHGRQSGLGLDVYDAYTGLNRDVKTLSGGEKFNASLCLALGMSDVIQSFQGGVSIETMFIDEGFGTLDEEALYKAVDTLIDLQQSGRMIGVISHVQELKTIFPAVLEVTKTKEGSSRTRLIVQ